MTVRNIDNISSLSDVESVSRHLGGHFFSRATMEFFGSKRLHTKRDFLRINNSEGLFVLNNRKHPTGHCFAVYHYHVDRYLREEDQRECDRIMFDNIGDFESLSEARDFAEATVRGMKP